MAGLTIPPINIPFVVAATALLICASIAKRFADHQPKKANKSQKGEILKQLLALSEHDGKVKATSSSIRSRTPVVSQPRRPAPTARKTPAKIAQPIRSSKVDSKPGRIPIVRA